MNKTKIALSLVALVGAANVLAQSVPNPLMRPTPQAQVSTSGVRGQSPLAPPGVSDMSMLMGGQGGQDGMGKNDKTDERVKSAQAAMARYNVVAVQGDTAVLRVTATAAPAAAAQSAGPSMGWANQGGNAAGSSGQAATAGSGDAAYGVLPSMVVKHKQRAVVQDVEVLADVQGGQVVLRTLDGKRAIYAGRLDGNGGRQMRGFVFTAPDAAYTARQSPPVSRNAAGGPSTGSAGNGAGNGVGLGSSLPSSNSN